MKIPFRQNVGMMDRMLRICIGIVLIVLAVLFVKGTVGTILMILSIPLLVSGIIGFCPSYVLLGISTKRENSCC
jgi:hypothetical protein